MHAAVLTKTGVEIREVAKPVPGDDEILIKVQATTVTRGDVVMNSLPGVMFWKPISSLLGVPPKKTIPGHEFAGVVEAVGSRVTAFNVGDAVFGTTTGLTVGANAEYVLVPQASQSSVLAHKPANMTNEQAVSLPIGSMTALYLLREAGEIGLGKQVLIYGASGSVGSYAVQIAKALGAEVTGVCSTRNLEMVKALGADYVIDYKMDDFSEQGKSYDVIFDAVGKTTANQRKRALKPDGAFTSIRANTHESPESLAFIAELVTN